MVYEVPASKRSVKQDVFEYKVGEKSFKVVSAKFLNGFQLESVTSFDLPAIFNIFGAKGTPAGDAVRSLETDQIADLVTAWTEASDLKPGESAAS